MRSSTILLLAATVLFLAVANAFSVVKDGNSAAISEDHPIRRSLKEVSTEYGGKEDEERAAISFSFLDKLNKYVPGTKAFAKASAARKAAANLKRLEKAAQKKKAENMFKVTGTREDQLTPKYIEWEGIGYDSVQVTNGVAKKMGWGDKKAIEIGNRFQAWLDIKKQKALLK